MPVIKTADRIIFFMKMFSIRYFGSDAYSTLLLRVLQTLFKDVFLTFEIRGKISS